MGKINTTNYPNRPVSSYQDDDMFILQDNGGETYTTNVGDIKDLIGNEIKLEGVKVDGSDLPITNKKVNVDLSGKTDLTVIAYPFYDNMVYYKGTYVTYNGKLYEFLQQHTGAWNASHAREINAAKMFVRAGNGGYNTGDYSTTEGHSTRAEGEASHAEGLHTIANSDNQHVEGKYNVADTDNEYAHIVGNGTADNARSNAMTLDWEGNLKVSGEVEDGNGEKISDKADKVSSATSGNLAGLDSNGNLADSGIGKSDIEEIEDALDVTYTGNPVIIENASALPAKSLKVKLEPIQSGSGTPSPDNVRPISGRTEESVKSEGKNLIPYVESGAWLFGDGTPDSGGKYLRTPKIKCKPNTSFVASQSTSNIDIKGFVFWNDVGEYLGYRINTAICTTPENTGYIAVNFSSVDLITISDIKNPQLEIGSLATDYVPYVSPSSVTLQFGTTVYGGEVDFETGVVTVDKGFVDLGDISWTRDNTYFLGVSSSLGAKGSINGNTPANMICSCYSNTFWNNTAENGKISMKPNGTRLAAYDSRYTDAAEFTTAVTGQTICYELATPTTIQLTPAQLTMLKGYNYVTADGDIEITVVSGNVYDDAKAYADETKAEKTYLADVEGDTASRAYSANEFMVRSDGFYKVTASIAQGASITSSNTTKTTVGEVLTALLNA